MGIRSGKWRKRLSSIDDQNGFSLIELLISVVLITFGMLALGQLTGFIVDKNDVSKKSSIAVTLGQDKIEFFKNLSLNSGLADGTGSEVVDEEGNTGTGGFYTRSWTIAETGAGTSLYNVSVTVAWSDDISRSKNVSTLIFQ